MAEVEVYSTVRGEQAAAAIEFGNRFGGGDVGALITAMRNAEHGVG